MQSEAAGALRSWAGQPSSARGANGSSRLRECAAPANGLLRARAVTFGVFLGNTRTRFSPCNVGPTPPALSSCRRVRRNSASLCDSRPRVRHRVSAQQGGPCRGGAPRTGLTRNRPLGTSRNHSSFCGGGIWGWLSWASTVPAAGCGRARGCHGDRAWTCTRLRVDARLPSFPFPDPEPSRDSEAGPLISRGARCSSRASSPFKVSPVDLSVNLPFAARSVHPVRPASPPVSLCVRRAELSRDSDSAPGTPRSCASARRPLQRQQGRGRPCKRLWNPSQVRRFPGLLSPARTGDHGVPGACSASATHRHCGPSPPTQTHARHKARPALPCCATGVPGDRRTERDQRVVQPPCPRPRPPNATRRAPPLHLQALVPCGPCACESG